jgi:predicted RNA-binding Zn-ribbon protein involved in translation (DUF1610 family)
MHHDTVADIVTVTAHGGCVEPGGMDLIDTAGSAACPRCGQPAHWWRCERVEDGSVNAYRGLTCAVCGHSEGDLPDEGD